MKIVVDAHILTRKEKTGVDYYTRGLLRSVTKIMKDDQFKLLYFGKPGKNLGIRRSNIRTKAIWWIPNKVFRGLAYKFFALPFDIVTLSTANVFFFPNFVSSPLLLGSKSVAVIYDLSFELHPQFVAKGNREHLSKLVKATVARTDHIVVISGNTKKEVTQYYAVPPKKITVVNPAVDHKHFYPRKEQEIAQTKREYGITKNYILFTSTIEPRKNVQGLLKAYRKLDESLRNMYSLVLAGKKGWLSESIDVMLQEMIGQGYNIITTGYVDEEDLPGLYSGSSVFVYPSFYEGFGMPPLEAMACGVPVIVANNSSLPEVVGEAGILVDAKNDQEISNAITKVLTDVSIAKNMQEKSLRRAQQFNWDKSGKKLADIFRHLKS